MFKSSLRILATLSFLIALTASAQAQATRTWVSGVGDDVNPCSRTAPCKTYAGAISKTARDGEISTLDPGGFGAITITKSITINGGGAGQGYGSILASLTNGVIINITDPADTRKTVRLDWLNINGASTGINGIRVLAANKVQVSNTLIDGFTNNGIDVSGLTATCNINVTDTIIRNCVGNGIRLHTNNVALAVAAINNVRIVGCGNGFHGEVNAIAVITGSQITLNTGVGVLSGNDTGNTISVENSTVSFNATGVQATNGIVRISNIFVTGSTTGLSPIAPGQIKSWGNNRVDGNSSNGSVTAPNLSQI